MTLAAVNMISLFGMRRCPWGANTGHLALYEMITTMSQAAFAARQDKLPGYRSRDRGAISTIGFEKDKKVGIMFNWSLRII